MPYFYVQIDIFHINIWLLFKLKASTFDNLKMRLSNQPLGSIVPLNSPKPTVSKALHLFQAPLDFNRLSWCLKMTVTTGATKQQVPLNLDMILNQRVYSLCVFSSFRDVKILPKMSNLVLKSLISFLFHFTWDQQGFHRKNVLFNKAFASNFISIVYCVTQNMGNFLLTVTSDIFTLSIWRRSLKVELNSSSSGFYHRGKGRRNLFILNASGVSSHRTWYQITGSVLGEHPLTFWDALPL